MVISRMIDALETPDGLRAAARSLARTSLRSFYLKMIGGMAYPNDDKELARLHTSVLDTCNTITFRPMLSVYAVGFASGERSSLGRVKTAMDACRLAEETLTETALTIVLVAEDAKPPFIEIRAGAASEAFHDGQLDRRLPALGWG